MPSIDELSTKDKELARGTKSIKGSWTVLGYCICCDKSVEMHPARNAALCESCKKRILKEDYHG